MELLEDRTVPTFLPAVHYPIAGGGLPLAADFTNDGLPDVLVPTSGGYELFLGNGDGTFQTPALRGQGVRAVQAGDFNGDGILDLVGPGNNVVGVWLGNGDGTFQAAVYSPLALAPSNLATGDLNGDGRLDLVAAPEGGYDGRLAMGVLLGNGDGTFQPEVSYKAGQQFGKAEVVDVNGDGVLDVVANFYKIGGFGGIGSTFPDIQTGWYVNAWLGNGDGTLRTPVDIRLENQAGGLVAADFNGDGVIDVAMPQLGSEYNSPPWSQSRVSVLLGNGDGTFRGPITQSVFPDSRPLTLAVADFNRDGRPDLAVTNEAFSWAGDTPVSVLLGNGDGTFQSPLNYDAHRGRPYLAVADFNQDQFPDLVTWNYTSVDISILINAADGAPTIPDPVTVQGVAISDGSARRSAVTSVTVTFSGAAVLDANAIELFREDGTSVGLEASTSEVEGQTVILLTFTDPDLIDGSLPDGSYTLLIHGDRVHDLFGQALDGDADGSPGGDRIEAFFRLLGDQDGDGDVDEDDEIGVVG